MDNLSEPSSKFHRFYSQCERMFASRWIVPTAIAIALLLTFRSVHNGLIGDDYYHRSVLSGSPRFGEQLRGPQAMFRFLIGRPEHARRWMDVGFLPWWTDPNVKAEFFQLIPTQTHILDYWLWPDRPELMHVHSLVWFALLVFLAARFYRRILGPTWMADVAALLFAITSTHAVPVGWICNRNDLIAASFGFGCLIAHDAWRREERNRLFGGALVLWALSLCSKEAGLATCAYLFAYALWHDASTPWRRFLSLVPYAIVVVVWRVARDALGYGAANMGFYVDPITDFGEFATALMARFPELLFGQWAMLSDLSLFFGKLGSPFWWIAVGYISLLGVLFWPLVRRDRIARFFATGMLLAVFPSCATFSMDRLLTFVGLGAFGLMVQFWRMVFAANAPRPKLALWRVAAVPVAVLLVLLHVVLSPLALAARAAAPLGPRKVIDASSVRVRFDKTIENQDLVVVNPPVTLLVGYCLLTYEQEGEPSPRAVRVLAPGVLPVTVKRTDDRTLEVEPEAGYLRLFDRLLRNERHPLHLGEQIHLARATVTVLAVTNDGRPQRVAFRFDTPLEDASLRWLRFRAGEFVPWRPPPVGEQVVLKTEWDPKLW
jgi:hypothetical protein